MDAKSEVAHRQKQIQDGDLPEYEPTFFLRARDVLAADVVLIWASLAESRGVPAQKVSEARQLAAAMKAWPVKQVPGLPETRITIYPGRNVSNAESVKKLDPELERKIDKALED